MYSVWREVVEEGGDRPGTIEIQRAREAGWFSIVEPTNAPFINLLKQELHPGEAESIALALEIKPDILLLDETEARQIAGIYDLPVTGIIGLLMQAKAEGEVASMREEMDRLRGEGGFWIRDELYRRILAAAGEEEERKK